MSENYQINRIYQASSFILKDIEGLLASNGLLLETGLTQFAEVRQSGKLIACAGLDGNIIKCVAIDQQHRGSSLTLSLITEVTDMAYRNGFDRLFLYTKPCNIPMFSAGGFSPLVTVQGRVTLMENSATRLSHYCKTLSERYQPGEKIGAIVINANPFTLGHRYLIEQAALQCDWVHLFVVREDASRFTYHHRFELIKAGIKGIENLTLFPGSDYILSKATFPAYFLKEQGIIDECYTTLDLMLFRQYIAPALGINYRFVGTEPFDPVTEKYNRDMTDWLFHAPSEAPPITVIQIPRIEKCGGPVSASRVRKLFDQGRMDLIRDLVPQATFEFLLEQANHR